MKGVDLNSPSSRRTFFPLSIGTCSPYMEMALFTSSDVTSQLISRFSLMYRLKSAVEGHCSSCCKTRALSAPSMSREEKYSLLAYTVMKNE